MAKHTFSVVDCTLTTKCLHFCQALSSQGMEFNFTLNFGSSFNFSLDTRKKSTSTEIVKKELSPYSVRRNARRKEAFLKQKAEAFTKSKDTSNVETSIQELETFQCDHCDYQVNCQVLLRKHMDKEHKLIPQLDGLKDSSSKGLDPCPLCKDSEEVPDIGGCGRYGSHGCGCGGCNCVTCHLVFNIKGAYGCKAICDELVKKVCKRCYTSFRNRK